MATPQQKAFCILQFAKTNTVTTVQRLFRTRFGIDPPARKTIYSWCRQFEDTGCICKGEALVYLVYQKRMWAELEKPSSEVRGNRLAEAVVSYSCPRRPHGVFCGKD
jgi:hypothetical protein